MYRASAYLRDGTHLPCVAFGPASAIVDTAMRRFDETRGREDLHHSVNYRALVKRFAAVGNRVDGHDIERAGESPYALPAARYEDLRTAGETSMGWTSFTGRMDDGAEFPFGSAFDTGFFDMPEGYTADRVAAVTRHDRSEEPAGEPFGEKPFFVCYLDLGEDAA